MRGSFSAHPNPIAWLVDAAFISVAVAIPFGRRDDWIGWIALLWMAAFAISLWALLIVSIGRNAIAWFRDKPTDTDDAEGRLCYDDYSYQLTWDCERFCLRNCKGDILIGVPLTNLLNIIDTDALFLENEVAIDAPGQFVVFPKSRSRRAKLVQLIRNLARSDPHVRQQIELRRNRLFRQGALWLPVSLVIAGALIAFAIIMPDPKHVNLIWGVLGVTYGLTWWWVLFRFAHSIASLAGARQLHSILSSATRNNEPTQ